MHREIKSTGEAKRDEFTIVSDREAERESGGYVFPEFKLPARFVVEAGEARHRRVAGVCRGVVRDERIHFTGRW